MEELELNLEDCGASSLFSFTMNSEERQQVRITQHLCTFQVLFESANASLNFTPKPRRTISYGRIRVQQNQLALI